MKSGPRQSSSPYGRSTGIRGPGPSRVPLPREACPCGLLEETEVTGGRGSQGTAGAWATQRRSDRVLAVPLRSVGSILLALLLALLVAPAASSPAPESAHVCAIHDYEQWRRDHPRPAAKRLADLDVGEPRTVRMIYFLPNDRPFRQEVVDSIKVRIRQVESFFVDQMEAHGHGRRTLRIETDDKGEPLVHRVDGQHPDNHYLDITPVV